MTENQLRKTIPFDQYSRQFQVRAILDNVRVKGADLRLLDVGGYQGHTADFLPNDNVTVLDLFDVTEKNYVQGSALSMPFDDRSFDYVLSFDVLEHIPADKRQLFLDECARVASCGIIVCAPNDTPANRLAETSLNQLYTDMHAKPHRWLREHIEYGIPDFSMVEAYYQKLTFQTVRFASNQTQLWVAMQEAIFLNSKFPIAAGELQALNSFYNQHLTYDGGGSDATAYRSILCCLRDPVAAAKLSAAGKLNEPIDPLVEIKLRQKLADFSYALITKTSQSEANYMELYQHEKQRADTLHSNSEELWKTINRLQSELEQQLQIHAAQSMSPLRRIHNKLRPRKS